MTIRGESAVGSELWHCQGGACHTRVGLESAVGRQEVGVGCGE